jgi:hypothetical protein
VIAKHWHILPYGRGAFVSILFQFNRDTTSKNARKCLKVPTGWEKSLEDFVRAFLKSFAVRLSFCSELNREGLLFPNK